MENPEPLPKWMMRRYAMLWNKFGNEEFTFEKAKDVLHENDKVLMVLFSRLNKMGWMKREQDSEDNRKRIYSVIPAEQVIGRMV